MKLIQCLLPLILFAHSQAQAEIFEISPEITLQSQISATGDNAQIAIKNHGDEPLICDQVNVSLTLVEGEFNQKVGTIETRFANVYVRRGETVNEAGIGADELQQLKAQGRSVRIFGITPAIGACKVATFDDYCRFATLDPEEKKTINALNQNYGARSCADWKPSRIASLHLSRFDLTDLRPLEFFNHLQVLFLHRNRIQDLSPLARLTKLVEVHLEGNPIESVDAIQSLPELAVACVGSTPFAKKGPVSKPFFKVCK